MRESVEEVKNNRGIRDYIQFTGKTGNRYTIYDRTLDPDAQIVEIEKIMPSHTIMTLQMPSADFELLVELMHLDKRGMRKVEDEA